MTKWHQIFLLTFSGMFCGVGLEWATTIDKPTCNFGIRIGSDDSRGTILTACSKGGQATLAFTFKHDDVPVCVAHSSDDTMPDIFATADDLVFVSNEDTESVLWDYVCFGVEEQDELTHT